MKNTAGKSANDGDAHDDDNNNDDDDDDDDLYIMVKCLSVSKSHYF